MDGKVQGSGVWSDFKSQGEQFLCSCLQKGNNNVKKSPGGLLSFGDWNNLQYVTTATFLATVYSDYLAAKHAPMQCVGGLVQPPDLISFAKSQVPQFISILCMDDIFLHARIYSSSIKESSETKVSRSILN